MAAGDAQAQNSKNLLNRPLSSLSLPQPLEAIREGNGAGEEREPQAEEAMELVVLAGGERGPEAKGGAG